MLQGQTLSSKVYMLRFPVVVQVFPRDSQLHHIVELSAFRVTTPAIEFRNASTGCDISGSGSYMAKRMTFLVQF